MTQGAEMWAALVLPGYSHSYQLLAQLALLYRNIFHNQKCF